MLALTLFLCFAVAEDVSAKELYYNAVTLAEEGELELAIEAFKAAYENSQKHALLYNISLLYEQTGQYKEALRKQSISKPKSLLMDVGMERPETALFWSLKKKKLNLENFQSKS